MRKSVQSKKAGFTKVCCVINLIYESSAQTALKHRKKLTEMTRTTIGENFIFLIYLVNHLSKKLSSDCCVEHNVPIKRLATMESVKTTPTARGPVIHLAWDTRHLAGKIILMLMHIASQYGDRLLQGTQFRMVVLRGFDLLTLCACITNGFAILHGFFYNVIWQHILSYD